MPRLSRSRSGRPPSSLPSASLGAQSDPLQTDSPGAAPPSRRREPASADRHPRRGHRDFLSACIRRAANALRLGRPAILDAAPAEASPAGPSGRPPREASAARPSRGGALRARGAAVLAAAVLLTGLLAAGGASAQTTNADGSETLWDAMMTVADVGGTVLDPGESDFGYHWFSGGTLTPSTFSVGSDTVGIDRVAVQTRAMSFTLVIDSLSQGGNASFSAIGTVAENTRRLALQVDSSRFLASDASVSASSLQWNNPGLSWAADDMVALKLIRFNAPSAPVNLRTKNKSATEITLKWAAPLKKGGLDITGYKIEESTDGITWTVLVADTMLTTTQYPLTGLTSGHMRHYRVSAINDVGTGPESNEAEGTAEDSAPEFSNAFVPSHNSSAVNVELDEDIDTTSIPDKSAFAVKVEGIDRTVTSVTAFGVDKGVTLGLASPVRPGEMVTVSYTEPGTNPLKDAAGNETASFTDRRVTNFLPPTRPDAPTNLTAEGISTTQIDLSWSAPEYDGGSDVKGYRIEVSTNRGIMWTDLVEDTGTTDTEYSHTGLTAGAMRTYRVSAINVAGWTGVPSNTATATAAQGSYTACSAASMRNRIWTANLTVGATGHLLGFSSSRGALSDTTFDLQGTAYAIDLVGTVGTTAFDFSLEPAALASTAGVVLHVGESKYRLADASLITSGHTYRFSSNVPDWADGDVVCLALTAVQATAPMNLTASATSATRIDLDWDAPDSGTPTGYKIEVSTNNGGTWSDLVADTSSTDTMYSDSSLTTSCSLRTYRVSAIAGTTTGPASNEAAAAPRAGPPGPAVVESGHTELWSSTLRVGFLSTAVGYDREFGEGSYGHLSNPLVRVWRNHPQDRCREKLRRFGSVIDPWR